MNPLAALFAPTVLPNAAGAGVRAQAGVQGGGDFANILAQFQNALTGNAGQTIDPAIQEASKILGQLPPGFLQSASALSTDELAAQLQALTGAPKGENTPQIDALMALLNPAQTGATAQPNKPAAPDTNSDTSLAAMLAALQIQTQTANAQPTQKTAEQTATSAQTAQTAPITTQATPADLGLRGSVATTDQPAAQQPTNADAVANAKAAENAVAALAVPNIVTPPKSETQTQPAQSAKTVTDLAKRKNPGATADAAAQNPDAPQTGKPSDTPSTAPAGANAQANAAANKNATAQPKTTDGAAQSATPSISGVPTPALPNVIDAQQMSVTVSAAPQAGVPLDALAVQIARKFEAGLSQFEISLHPAELGQLDISLSVGDDGHIQASVRAERPETLDLLQRDVRSLEQQLRQAGLEVGSNALSFSLSGGNGQQRQAPFAGWPAFADAHDAAGTAKQNAATAYIAVRKPDGVDIRV